MLFVFWHGLLDRAIVCLDPIFRKWKCEASSDKAVGYKHGTALLLLPI